MVEIIDRTSGLTVHVLHGHTNWVRGVAFSPDGSLLATASADHTARLWDATTGQPVAVLLTLPEDGYAVLLPNGTYKLAGDASDTLWWSIKLCRFAPGELDPFIPGLTRVPHDFPIW